MAHKLSKKKFQLHMNYYRVRIPVQLINSKVQFLMNYYRVYCAVTLLCGKFCQHWHTLPQVTWAANIFGFPSNVWGNKFSHTLELKVKIRNLALLIF